MNSLSKSGFSGSLTNAGGSHHPELFAARGGKESIGRGQQPRAATANTRKERQVSNVIYLRQNTRSVSMDNERPQRTLRKRTLSAADLDAQNRQKVLDLATQLLRAGLPDLERV